MLAKKKQAILPTQWGHRCWLKFHSFCSRPPEIHSFSSIVLRSSSPRHTHPNNPPAPLVGPPACDGSSVTLARSFFHVRFGHEVNCSPFKFALSMKAGKVITRSRLRLLVVHIITLRSFLWDLTLNGVYQLITLCFTPSFPKKTTIIN